MSWPSMACVQTRQQSVHTKSVSKRDSAALLEYSVRGIIGEGVSRVPWRRAESRWAQHPQRWQP